MTHAGALGRNVQQWEIHVQNGVQKFKHLIIAGIIVTDGFEHGMHSTISRYTSYDADTLCEYFLVEKRECFGVF